MNAASAITILQWNVGNFDIQLRPGGRGPRGMHYTHASASREEDLAQLAAVIRAEDPDLATLQEVDVNAGHHERLAALAGDYEVAAVGPPDRHTQVVLRHRRIEATGEGLPARDGFNAAAVRVRAPVPEGGGGRRTPRLPGKQASPGEAAELVVVSTHSSAGKFTEDRAAQHRALAGWAGALGREVPIVVGGDFNFDAEPHGLHYRLYRLRRRLPFLPALVTSDWAEDCRGLAALAEVLDDLAAPAGKTCGAPRHWARILPLWAKPLLPAAWLLGVHRLRGRLDYIWGSSAVRALDARVLRLAGGRALGHPAVPRDAFPWMDHDPVLLRFVLDEVGAGS